MPPYLALGRILLWADHPVGLNRGVLFERKTLPLEALHAPAETEFLLAGGLAARGLLEPQARGKFDAAPCLKSVQLSIRVRLHGRFVRVKRVASRRVKRVA